MSKFVSDKTHFDNQVVLTYKFRTIQSMSG